MGDEVDAGVDPEGHLLRVATGFDVAGRAADSWPTDLRAEVMRRLPRLSFDDEFICLFSDQARRKPSSSAAVAMGSGLADRMSANVLRSG